MPDCTGVLQNGQIQGGGSCKPEKMYYNHTSGGTEYRLYDRTTN
jgi:hypothetical protein